MNATTCFRCNARWVVLLDFCKPTQSVLSFDQIAIHMWMLMEWSVRLVSCFTYIRCILHLLRWHWSLVGVPFRANGIYSVRCVSVYESERDEKKVDEECFLGPRVKPFHSCFLCSLFFFLAATIKEEQYAMRNLFLGWPPPVVRRCCVERLVWLGASVFPWQLRSPRVAMLPERRNWTKAGRPLFVGHLWLTERPRS